MYKAYCLKINLSLLYTCISINHWLILAIRLNILHAISINAAGCSLYSHSLYGFSIQAAIIFCCSGECSVNNPWSIDVSTPDGSPQVYRLLFGCTYLHLLIFFLFLGFLLFKLNLFAVFVVCSYKHPHEVEQSRYN